MDYAEHTLRVGPAGWAYADWNGVVYPARMPKGAHALDYLSRWFDTVEINVSFYRPVPPDHARSWAGRVASNPRFQFTAKLWQRFTHESGGPPRDEDISQFLRGIEPLAEAGRLGAVLMQFPQSFHRTAENRRRLAGLIAAFHALPLAVEVRHDSWQCAAFFEGLAEHGVAFCNIDQPALRHCVAATQEVTSPLGYARLHGRNSDAWFAEGRPSYERYNYLYAPEELDPWVARIRSIGLRAQATYAVTNNHFQGKAVANAFEILAGLGRAPREMPESLIAAFPRLRAMLEQVAKHAEPACP